MKTFIVKWQRSELWRLNLENKQDAAIAEGISIRAFTPWGAGMKACRTNPFGGGLKNCEVLEGDYVYRCFYPRIVPLLAFLDAPVSAMQHWNR